MRNLIKKLKSFKSLLAPFLMQLVPLTTWATNGGPGTSGGVTPPDTDLPNPLGDITTLEALLDRITGALMVIAIPIVAIMIIYGAFQILTAGGDPEGFKKGKSTILYAVIGYAIILVAKGITAIIKELLGAP